MKTGIATFSLDTGRCPTWLFRRMKQLGGLMAEMIIEEYDEEELLKRLSDPTYFQALGCSLAFDWNSSGLTVVLLAALKESFRERNLKIHIFGGKGKTSRKTPMEILTFGEKKGFDPNPYIKLSKLIAKIDNNLIQDSFSLYHHSFILNEKGSWGVIQQGLNLNSAKARRYHWYGGRLEPDADLTEESHQGIASQIFLKNILNLTAQSSRANKDLMVKLINQPKELNRDLKIFLRPRKSLFLDNHDFYSHPVNREEFNLKRLRATLEKTSSLNPQDIENLVLAKGVGPKTIRALSLVAELVYKEPASKIDPARYTFIAGLTGRLD
ncbi:MAG: DUF763 domain-containing protein, partial [Patescibacteria group bacterium]|nr:DUF763 domain-containing protein [Patescibacteria group bacterium]